MSSSTMEIEISCPVSRLNQFTEASPKLKGRKMSPLDPDNHDDVITNLEPDILECEVKWAVEASLRTKLVEVMEFQ